jgi:hypothetical protein
LRTVEESTYLSGEVKIALYQVCHWRLHVENERNIRVHDGTNARRTTGGAMIGNIRAAMRLDRLCRSMKETKLIAKSLKYKRIRFLPSVDEYS